MSNSFLNLDLNCEVLNVENNNLNEKITLPMAKPIITTYPMDANAISIISNDKETYPWLLNNFMQIMSWDRVELPWKLDIWYSDSFKFYKKCPFLDCQRIKKHFIRDKWNDDINESAYEPKRESDRPHDMLIYGYDAIQKIFYVADNFKYGKYSFSTCTFGELENAVHYLREEDENYAGFSSSIELLSYKKPKNRTFDFDLNKVTDGLKAYSSSKAFDEWAYPNAIYGINVYDTYKLYLSLLHNNEVKFDIRPVHLFWEHKFVMMLRLNYMNENDMLHNEDNILSAYKEIEQKTLSYRNLLLKYKINKNQNTLKHIIEELDENKYKESLVLERVLLNIRPMKTVSLENS
jgi:hypothetical protein